MPEAVGAVTVKVNAPMEPGGTFLVNDARLGPQLVLFAGLCDPSLKELVDQVVLPVFFILTDMV